MSMDPSDALLAARDLLRERGWAQGRFHDDYGRSCISGALISAAPDMVFKNSARGPLIEVLDERYGVKDVFTANDHHIADLDEACDVLEAAAKRAAEGGS